MSSPDRWSVSRAAAFAVTLFVIACPPARAQSPTAQPGAHVRPGWYLVNGIWLRPSGASAWSDLIRFTYRDGRLATEITITGAARPLLQGGRHVAVEVGPSKDMFLVNGGEFRGRVAGGVLGGTKLIPQGKYLQALALPTQHDDPQAPMRVTSVSVREARVELVGEGFARGAAFRVTFASDQGGEEVALIVESTGADAAEPGAHITAATLGDLVAAEPRAARLYLASLLRRLCGRDPLLPGPADVYRAFPQIEPDPRAVEALRALLPELDHRDPRRREDAMRQLEALGPAGACAALRVPQDDLTPQQRLALRQFLRAQSRLADTMADPAVVHADPLFLADCLHDPDPRVRAAAKARLEQRLGRAIQFDPDAPEADRFRAAMVVMESVLAQAGRR